MKTCRIYICIILVTVLSTFVSSRAVNISNTWMLPEEGFPVFYRYFRDRISWYEADAVCQFHHANLVTADSTSQYDAIRAYLKEMDIIENVWIGLSKTTEKPNFTWTNFHPLSGDGYWQQTIPDTNEAICVSMDPAADFLWKFMTCGGPDVASFICELPVPSWAMGLKGCLFTELPSLTVLYIPEQLALELTSDCGLDGTKKVTCKGNADRKEILRQLTCAISSDEFSTSPSTAYDVSFDEVSSSGKTTKPWTLNTVEIDYGPPTRHRRETEDTVSPLSTRSTTDLSVLDLDNKAKLSTSSNSKDAISTNSKENDTLDSIVLDITTAYNPTQSSELTTQNKQLSYQDSSTSENNVVTVSSSTADLPVHDNEEFSSAIGQGQLFSIFENGTMFDIIEVNETESNDGKFDHEVIMETPQSETDILGTSTANSLYTTAVYHDESFSQTNNIKESVKNFELFSKKHTFQNKYPTKSNEQNSKLDDMTKIKKPTQVTNFGKSFSKEIETVPILDSQITLNRTFRKELSPEFTNNQYVNTAADLSKINKINSDKHQHIEVKWDQRKNKNLMQMNLIVTTKRIDSTVTKQNLDESNSEAQKRTDDKVLLSKMERLGNKTSANTSNTFLKVETNKLSEESVFMKKQLLPKSLTRDVYRESGVITVPSSSSEPLELEPEPQAQPRPNRQRQLTRPQRRSFYPYFFSRVLG